MTLFNKKSNLDEFQEMQLLKIESRGCWLAFWGLFLVYMGQLLAGLDFRHYAGEMILFLTLAFYLAIECQRKGIWDRHLKPNTRTNFIISVASAVIFAAIFGVRSYVNYHSLPGSIAVFIFIALFLFFILFFTLTLMVRDMRKREKKRAAVMDSEED